MDRDQRAMELFLECCDLAADARQRYLGKACGEDPSLREQVEQMIAFEQAEPSFLARPVTDQVLGADPSGQDGTMDLPSDRGSYKILGELARGGMGIVLKGHDARLDRDVAVKILHANLCLRPAVLKRFLDEARINGRLQHPGIVPVYELGSLSDERPFFVMKLVEGRTLAALLQERSDPTRDRSRLLEIFTAICQTLAFAHSRGVIHRDVKPDNVMVGSFGEVQVLDWGIAKVLSGSQDWTVEPEAAPALASEPSGNAAPRSLSGSVMGTPAYMPPEQAQGRVEQLDERSDVFALGAILCEILTGLPPYTGDSNRKLRQAADADLGDAGSRLERCTADAELVALTRACLSASPAARPRHAGVVADRMHAYLVSLEDRARRAQIEAAEARGKAAEERRARKLTLALAGSVALTIALALGGWLVIDAQRTRRERRTLEMVAAALSDATLWQGQEKWSDAVAAAQRAQALAQAGRASDALRARVVEKLAQLTLAKDAAEQHARRERENAELLAMLEEIRQPEGTRIYPTQWGLVDQAYARVLGGFHLDDVDRGTATAMLETRGISSALAAALDEWSGVRRQAHNQDGARRLSELARDLDRDAKRDELRAALMTSDVAALPAFVTAEDLSTLPAPTLNLLGAALRRAGAMTEALQVLRVARRAHPTDFILCTNLARALRASSVAGRTEAAARHYEAALALRPESVEVRHELGQTLQLLTLMPEAEGLFRASLALRPDDAHLHFHLGSVLAAQHDLAGAVESYERALELDPDDATTYNNLGAVLDEQGDLEGAVDCYRLAIERDPDYAPAHRNLGGLLEAKGDHGGAITSCRQGLRLDPSDARGHSNLGNALKSSGDLAAASASYRRALELDPNLVQAHIGLGNVFMARGEAAQAIAQYRQAIELDPRYAKVHYDLGHLLEKQGELEPAIKSYRHAIERDPRLMFAHWSLGYAQARMGDLDGAVATYRRALEIDPDHVDILGNLGAIRARQGDQSEAMELYRQALEIDPQRANIRVWLGELQYQAGEFDEGLASLRRAVGLDPESARGHVALGGVLVQQGDLAGAIEHFDVALRVAPGRPGELEAGVGLLAKSLVLEGAADAATGLFLAAAEQALGHPEQAREWLRSANAWIERNGAVPEALARYRTQVERPLLNGDQD